MPTPTPADTSRDPALDRKVKAAHLADTLNDRLINEIDAWLGAEDFAGEVCDRFEAVRDGEDLRAYVAQQVDDLTSNLCEALEDVLEARP